MADRVSLTIEDHVAHVALDRPEKFNAVDLEMIEALIATGEALSDNPEVRAVVMTGSGEHFCAGIDLGIFQSGANVLGPELMSPMDGSSANFFQRAATVWREVPAPVVTAIHGICYGAGLQIALGADIRIAKPDATLSVMEVKWGIVPDMGLTVTARGLLRRDELKELALTGRVVTGSEARSAGLVTATAEDPLAAARDLASAIAARSPDATSGIKTLLDAGMEGSSDDALALEARLQLSILGRPNQVEAVAANVEKRAPDFGPRGSSS